MSLKIATTCAIRRPTLLRVWCTTGQPNAPLTSTWLPTPVPSAHTEGDVRP